MNLLFDCSSFKPKKNSESSLYEISTQDYNQAREFWKRVKINQSQCLTFIFGGTGSPAKVLQ